MGYFQGSRRLSQPAAETHFWGSVDAPAGAPPRDENQGALTRRGGNERSERGNTPLQSTNRQVLVSEQYLRPCGPPPPKKIMPSPWNHAGSPRRRTLPCQARLQSLAVTNQRHVASLTSRRCPAGAPQRDDSNRVLPLCLATVPPTRRTWHPVDAPVPSGHAIGRTLVPGALRANSPHPTREEFRERLHLR